MLKLNYSESRTERNIMPGASGKKDGDIKSGLDILLDDPSLFLNRELSWLKFNKRVLKKPLPVPRLGDLLMDIFTLHLADNVHARTLGPDISCVHMMPAPAETPPDSRQWLVEHRGFLLGD
jgi:polyphosphate kinase